MTKTIIATLLALSFSATACADLSFPLANDADSVNVVLSGTVDVGGGYTHGGLSWNNQNLGFNNFSFDLNKANFGVEVSAPFKNAWVGFGKFTIIHNEQQLVSFGKAFVGLTNDHYGTFTVGNQDNAAATMALNAFDRYDVKSKTYTINDPISFAWPTVSFPDLSFVLGPNVKYVSPEFKGLTVAVSGTFSVLQEEAATNPATKIAEVKDADITQQYSLGATFERSQYKVAATVTVEPQDSHLNVLATLGASAQIHQFLLFGNLTLDKHLKDDMSGNSALNTMLQLGTTYQLNDADKLSGALQYGYLATLTKKELKKPNLIPSTYIIGLKVAYEHSFNSVLTGYVYGGFNYASFTEPNGESDQPVMTSQQYGAGLKLDF